MSARYRAQSLDRRLYGVFAGVVEDNDDPDKEGRVKVRYPWLDDATVSDWCRVMQPYAGKNFGAVFVPEKQCEVLVAFTHGDMNEPVVIGGLYNGKDKPPTYHDGTKLDVKMIKTKAGHVFRMDDTEKARGVELKTVAGNDLFLDDQNKNITIKTPAGNLAVLDDKNHLLKLQSAAGYSAVIDDTGAKMTLTCGGSTITLEASGAITIKGTTITVSGSTINLN